MGRLFTRAVDFFRETDKLLLSLCTLASLYGCAGVYSATRYIGGMRSLIVQLAAMMAGIVCACVISCFDFETFTRRWYFIAAVGLIPVILTFFIGFAPDGTDDKAWLDLGFTTFQPAELLKICFVVTFSAHLARVKSTINNIKTLIPLCLHAVFPVLLIHFQGDDGTALVFAVMVVCMFWAAGLSWKYFVAVFFAAAAASPLVYFFVMNNDQRARIISIFDVETDIKGIGYQQWRARVALANGGFAGQGYLKGDLTSVGGVPEGQNDFIFVSIGEELGFLGCMAIILLIVAICLRFIRIAKLCGKDSGKLMCVGMFGIIFAQSIINIGMSISILPVIGITLPFFSAGGTSMLCLYLGIGLVLSVYKHRNSRTIYLRD